MPFKLLNRLFNLFSRLGTDVAIALSSVAATVHGLEIIKVKRAFLGARPWTFTPTAHRDDLVDLRGVIWINPAVTNADAIRNAVVDRLPAYRAWQPPGEHDPPGLVSPGG